MLTIDQLEAALADQQAISDEHPDQPGVSVLVRSDIDPAAAVVLSEKRARLFLRTAIDDWDPDRGFPGLINELHEAMRAAWVDGAMTGARAMRDDD